MAHELAQAFDRAGLPLCQTLCEMLDEHPKHRTVRRGCGLTQCTRFLADRINRAVDPLDPFDLSLFASLSSRRARVLAARAVELDWPLGWRALDAAPAAVCAALADLPGGADLLALPATVKAPRPALALEESRLVLRLMIDVLCRQAAGAPELPLMPEKPEIGSCSQAEEFFLEIAHGKIRRGGRVNIVVDADGRPLLVEKMDLGESHSAIFLQAATLCGVVIPPGGLAALDRDDTVPTLGRYDHGAVLPLAALRQVRFLRLTTLAVEPAHRERAFSEQFRRQVAGNMLSPASTTLDDLRVFADQCVKAT